MVREQVHQIPRDYARDRFECQDMTPWPESEISNINGTFKVD